MRPKRILILGASGIVGKCLVDELVRNGVRVRTTVLDAERAARSQHSRHFQYSITQELEWVRFDYLQEETYDGAFESMDAVFLVTPLMEQLGDVIDRVIDACQRHQIRRIVRLSAYGVDADHGVSIFDRHREAEMLIQASGISWTFLRPNGYFQNYLTLHAQTIRSKDRFCAPAGNARVSMIDARDVAEVAAVVLLEGRYDGQALELTGREALSNEMIAETLSRRTGRAIRYVPIGDEEAFRMFKERGFPDWKARALIEVYQFYREGLASAVLPTVHKLTGRLPTSFDRFAAEHASDFSSDLYGMGRAAA